jgi:AraC-like DNA-binding protein
MHLLQSILSYFVYFGGFLALLLAVQQVIARKRELANFLRFSHLLVNGVMLCGTALLANKVPLEYPFSLFLYFTCGFLLGPSYLFSISTLLGSRTGLKKADVLHFLPAIIVFTGEMVFQLQGTAFKQDMLRIFLTQPLQSPLAPLFAAAIIFNAVYEFMVMKGVIMFWNNPEIKKEVRIISIRVVASFLALSLFSAGIFRADPVVILLGGAVHAGIMISILITQDYYPQFFFALKREIRRKRYERSLLLGLNTDVIRNRLGELMDDEKLYRDMELNLQTLADRLSITPHQLSQFLNDQVNSNFRNYINGFRVKEARRLLEHNSDMSVSAICYEVGFNSKSTFNMVFKEATGKTPREFREELK